MVDLNLLRWEMTLGSGVGPDIITRVLIREKGRWWGVSGGGGEVMMEAEAGGTQLTVLKMEEGATTQGRQQFLKAGRARKQSPFRLLTFKTTRE